MEPWSVRGQSDLGDLVGNLNPGVTRCGLIIFEVPRNLSRDNLTLRFRGGVTGNYVDLPLMVNSSVKQSPAETRPSPDVSPQSDESEGVQQEPPPTPQPDAGNPQTSPAGTQQEPAPQSQPDATSPQPAPAGTQQPAPIVRELPSNTSLPQSPN